MFCIAEKEQCVCAFEPANQAVLILICFCSRNGSGDSLCCMNMAVCALPSTSRWVGHDSPNLSLLWTARCKGQVQSWRRSVELRKDNYCWAKILCTWSLSLHNAEEEYFAFSEGINGKCCFLSISVGSGGYLSRQGNPLATSYWEGCSSSISCMQVQRCCKKKAPPWNSLLAGMPVYRKFI